MDLDPAAVVAAGLSFCAGSLLALIIVALFISGDECD